MGARYSLASLTFLIHFSFRFQPIIELAARCESAALGAPIGAFGDSRFATVGIGGKLTSLQRGVFDDSAGIEIAAGFVTATGGCAAGRAAFSFRCARRAGRHSELRVSVSEIDRYESVLTPVRAVEVPWRSTIVGGR